MRLEAKGKLFAILTACSWSLVPICIKKGLVGLPPITGAAVSLLSSTLLQTFQVWWSGGLKEVATARGRALMYLTLAGLANTAAVLTYYLALARTQVIVAQPIVSTNRLVTVALSHLLIQHLEHITPRVWLGAALTIAGTLLIIFK